MEGSAYLCYNYRRRKISIEPLEVDLHSCLVLGSGKGLANRVKATLWWGQSLNRPLCTSVTRIVIAGSTSILDEVVVLRTKTSTLHYKSLIREAIPNSKSKSNCIDADSLTGHLHVGKLRSHTEYGVDYSM